MKDFQNSDMPELEQTLISIWKEFAWYLKEVAKKHDDLIDKNRENLSTLNTEVAKINTTLKQYDCTFKDLKDNFNNFKEDFEEVQKSVLEHHQKDKVGWTVTEKIVAVIGALITIGLAVWSLLK